MKKIWTIVALVCTLFIVSCASSGDKAAEFAKQLDEVAGTDKADKIKSILKSRSEYEKILTDEQKKEYDAAWLAAIETETGNLATAVVKAVKDCDVAKAQSIETKIRDYKKGLYEDEIAKFDELLTAKIKENKLTEEDIEKFNKAVYAWAHPFEKLLVVE